MGKNKIEYEYYDNTGKNVCTLMRRIEDVLEELDNKDRYIAHLEYKINMLVFELTKIENEINQIEELLKTGE